MMLRIISVVELVPDAKFRDLNSRTKSRKLGWIAEI